MENSINPVSAEQKNYTAIIVMRCMLLKYAEQRQLPFEQALLEFGASPVYEALFDFDTEIWKEGPDYLMGLYRNISIERSMHE